MNGFFQEEYVRFHSEFVFSFSFSFTIASHCHTIGYSRMIGEEAMACRSSKQDRCNRAAAECRSAAAFSLMHCASIHLIEEC
jgi:hypothetical protein